MKIKERIKCKKYWLTGGVICILLIIVGISIVAVKRNGQNENVESKQKNSGNRKNLENVMGESISALGYASYGTISQSLNLAVNESNTLLEVEEVSVSQGDTVASGDALLVVTKESYDNVKSYLENAYDDAKSNLKDAKVSYMEGKLEAEYTYLSNSQLKNISLANYNSEVASLNKAVKEAKEEYEQAKKTVSENPDTIASNKKKIKTYKEKLTNYENQATSYQKKIEGGQEQYKTLKDTYLKTLNEYKAVLYTYRYLLLANNESTPKIEEMITTVESQITTVTEQNITISDSSDTESQSQSTQDLKDNKDSEKETQTSESAPTNAPEKEDNVKAKSVSVKENEAAETTLSQLLNQIKSEYENLTNQYLSDKADYESNYNQMSKWKEQLTFYQEKKTTVNSKITTLTEKNKTLQTAYEEANSKLASLKNTYVTALNEQVTKLVSLKKDYESDVITSEAAATTYKESLNSLQEALQESEDFVTQTKEYLDNFTNVFSGYTLCAQYAGTISSIYFVPGDSIADGAAIVDYQDADVVTTTISVNQEDVGKIAVGDSAMIMDDSGSRYEGTVQSIASSTTSDSISDVSYEVVIRINMTEENTLSTSDALSVYLNRNGREQGNTNQEVENETKNQ